jgi:AbrB family looped-hinge helix DNA binding protein
VKIGRQGRVVIPASIRRELGIEPGDDLSVRVRGRSLVLEPPDVALERARRHFRDSSADGQSLVDELIADRRKEARMERERWKRLGFD